MALTRLLRNFAKGQKNNKEGHNHSKMLLSYKGNLASLQHQVTLACERDMKKDKLFHFSQVQGTSIEFLICVKYCPRDTKMNKVELLFGDGH